MTPRRRSAISTSKVRQAVSLTAVVSMVLGMTVPLAVQVAWSSASPSPVHSAKAGSTRPADVKGGSAILKAEKETRESSKLDPALQTPSARVSPVAALRVPWFGCVLLSGAPDRARAR